MRKISAGAVSARSSRRRRSVGRVCGREIEPPCGDQLRRAAGERHADTGCRLPLLVAVKTIVLPSRRQREVAHRQIGRLEHGALLAGRTIVDVEIPAIRLESGPPLRADDHELAVGRERPAARRRRDSASASSPRRRRRARTRRRCSSSTLPCRCLRGSRRTRLTAVGREGDRRVFLLRRRRVEIAGRQVARRRRRATRRDEHVMAHVRRAIRPSGDTAVASAMVHVLLGGVCSRCLLVDSPATRTRSATRRRAQRPSAAARRRRSS